MKEFEKLEQSEIRITSQSKTVGWLDNYWYHYKWHTIIFIFVVTLLIFMITQCMQVKKNDIIFYEEHTTAKVIIENIEHILRGYEEIVEKLTNIGAKIEIKEI